MPPKKRPKVSRAEKEKPLLTVQGVLRLDKSFQKAQHADAETLKVNLGTEDEDKIKEIRLIPGESEHDQVSYKAGYDIGPANPFPQNQPEKEIFEAQRKVDEKAEAFEELKQQVAEERQQIEDKLRAEGKKVEAEEDDGTSPRPETPPAPAVDPETRNPDNPNNYYLPGQISGEAGFHNDRPLEFGKKASIVLPPGEEDEQQLITDRVASEAPMDDDDDDLVQFQDPYKYMWTVVDSGSGLTVANV